MPVGSGGNVPANLNLGDPAGYMEPPAGMTQAQALEEMANMALAAGVVSSGTWNPPPTTPLKRPPATPIKSRVAPIPKSARFHEPAAVPQQEVITAYKRAKLLFTAKSVRLVGAVEDEYEFGHEQVAVCKHASEHPPGTPVPAKSHRCGFYAMYHLEDIEESFWSSNCTIEVQMFGRVVKGRTGCRAEKQRIIGVLLDARTCDGLLCNETPMALGMPPGLKLDGKSPEDFQALCRTHFDGYDPLRRVTLAHLRNVTGMEFRFLMERPTAQEEDDE